MLVLPMLGGSGASGVLTLTVATNQTNFNLKTAVEAIYGVQSSAVTVVCTINPGVQISSSSRLTPAFTTGGFPAGSDVHIDYDGARIGGKAGGGGDGASTITDATGGADGGDALDLQDDTFLDGGTTGNLFGGGGGGGGGGYATSGGYGGGGGGGQGDGGGSGGSKGGGSAQNGGAGSASNPGSGGDGDPGFILPGGKGGRGGSWGASGNKGKDGSGGGAHSDGKSGGSAGNAVRKNGHSLTWLAGNNATQVKGAVS